MGQPVILIVEDDENARDIFSTLLRHHGFDVQEARNGEQVLELAREHKPAVVLMDLSMPIVDGWTALRQLKANEHTADIPVVALTAHSMEGDRRRTQDAGFDSYLAKPLDPHRVLSEVRRLIGMPSH